MHGVQRLEGLDFHRGMVNTFMIKGEIWTMKCGRVRENSSACFYFLSEIGRKDVS